MMTFSRFLRLSFLFLLATAAVAARAQVYPKLEKANIFVSPDTVSLWTEVPAKDYLIPNSQMFVSGHESDWVKYFGLLGVMVNQSQNATATSSVEDALRLKFDRELARELNARIAARVSSPSKFQVTDNADAAQVKLLPSARLVVIKDDGRVHLTFRLSARYSDEATEVKKEYYFSAGFPKPMVGLGGWVEDNGSELRKAADRALPAMAEVLLDDLSGAFASAYAPESRRFIRISGTDPKSTISRAVLAKEYPDYLAIVPTYKDKVWQSFISIVDRRITIVHPN